MSERWLKLVIALLVIGTLVDACGDSLKTTRLNLMEQRIKQLEQQVRR